MKRKVLRSYEYNQKIGKYEEVSPPLMVECKPDLQFIELSFVRSPPDPLCRIYKTIKVGQPDGRREPA